MADTRKPRTQQRPSQAGKGKQSGKLAKGAAARRLAQKRRRQRALAWSGTAVVVVAVLVGVVVWQGRGDTDKVDPQALASARQAAGCGAVQQFPQAGRTHIAPNQQPSNWNSNPPTSGDHLATPLARGAYDAEQDERAVVHNLEHGYVVIQYKNLPPDQVEQLRDYVRKHRGDKLILNPYSGLPSDGMALTAWQHLQTCKQGSVDVVKGFVADFMVPVGRRSTAPEPAAA
jgi:hypothetical protein